MRHRRYSVDDTASGSDVEHDHEHEQDQTAAEEGDGDGDSPRYHTPTARFLSLPRRVWWLMGTRSPWTTLRVCAARARKLSCCSVWWLWCCCGLLALAAVAALALSGLSVLRAFSSSAASRLFPAPPYPLAPNLRYSLSCGSLVDGDAHADLTTNRAFSFASLTRRSLWPAAAFSASATLLPRVLIHVPVHAHTPVESVRRFIDASFTHRPYLDGAAAVYGFDVMFVSSGMAAELPAASQRLLRAVNASRLADWSGSGSGSSSSSADSSDVSGSSSSLTPDVLVECAALSDDAYERSRLSERWVRGPNAHFESVMHERGALFERVTNRYQYVLQMETDVLTLADGWLGATMQPVSLGTPFIAAGARLEPQSMVCDDALKACTPLSLQPDYIQQHINGNALYRMDATLQRALNHSIAHYLHWPFDLSLWLACRDLRLEPLLLASPQHFSTAQPVPVDALTGSRAAFVLATGAHTAVVVAHVSQANRRPQLEAALVRLSADVPLTVTFVSASHIDYALNLLASLQAAQVPNVLCVAFDQASYEALKRAAPSHYAVMKNATSQTSASSGSTAFKSASFVQLCNARHAVLSDVLQRNYSLVSLDTDVYVRRNYLPHLLALPSDRLHFMSDAVGATGFHFYNETVPRYHFNAGMFYVPHALLEPAAAFFSQLLAEVRRTGVADQDVLNRMLVCHTLSECVHGPTGVRAAILEPTLFYNGGNYFSRRWPTTAHTEQAIVVHNNWSARSISHPLTAHSTHTQRSASLPLHPS